MNEDIIRGRFSKDEDQFVKDNYLLMSDEQIASHLHRTAKSITNARVRLGIMDKIKQGFIPPSAKENRSAYVATLTDKDRAEFIRKELRGTSFYKQAKKCLGKDELEFYEDKIVAFKMDPTIETMTVMEEDALHSMTIQQIRMHRYMVEERIPDKKTKQCFSKSKEIRECEETIQKYQESLNVQRKQRLKNINDQAANFTTIIRELKDPNKRREAGCEAAMLKFMTEKYYNDYSDQGNPERTIFSGREELFNINKLFKGEAAPSGLSSQFT